MIGIIGAMDEEVAILKESMEVQDTMERAGMTFVKGIMSGKEVVVVRSGIGKVNMGICAQILIDCFGVDTLINTGVAGSLDADINIGDIVISTDAVQHDMDVSMLGAAMAQTAYLNKVSYVIIRAISDKADNSATMDYPEFVKMAITHYVGLVKGLVERM